MENRLGSLLTYISMIGVLAFGFIYLLRPSFMPYQADAVGMSWEEVPHNFQRLIWTYMKAASGGWIALGIVFMFLQHKFNQNKEMWIPYLILLGSLIFAATSLMAAIGLQMTTPAKPPLLPILLIIFLMLLGFYFNWKHGKNKG